MQEDKRQKSSSSDMTEIVVFVCAHELEINLLIHDGTLLLLCLSNNQNQYIWNLVSTK